MAADALASPIGSPTLEDLMKGAKGIAIIVDDATRPTPVAKILAVLLNDLEQQGFPKNNISIIVALGSHAPLSKAGLAERLGAAVASSYLKRKLAAKGGIRKIRLHLYLGEYVWRYNHRRRNFKEQESRLIYLIN